MTNRIPARLETSIGRWLVGALCLCALVLVPHGLARAAGAPTMNLVPVGAPPGSQATANLSGFDACVPVDDVAGTPRVTIVWDAADIIGSAPIESGAASIDFLVPSSAKLGAHRVRAICETNQKLTAPGTFDVIAPKVQPAVVPDVTSLSVDDASVHLKMAGLVLGEVTGGGGVVEKQDPAANVEVPSGTPVDVDLGTTAPRQVMVPSLIGLTSDEARGALSDVALTLGTLSGSGDIVAAQSPLPFAFVAPGSNVNVTLRAPSPRLVPVPDLVGSEVAAAPQILGARGLVLGDVAGSGAVIRDQNPSPQTLVRQGTEVAVSVAALVPPPALVRVPDFGGMSVDDARKTAADLKLAMAATTTEGTVVDQEPAPGTMVPVGSMVSIRVKTAHQGPPVLPLVLAGIGGAAMLAGAYRVVRTRRAKNWVRHHVSVAPEGTTLVGAVMKPAGDRPPHDVVVRIDSHIDAGTHRLEVLRR